jgi:hypothetical protein
VNLLRGLLFDNLGLKLVALLLSVLVYLNVYTDRPARMIVTFPIQVTDLADSLSLSGPVPAAVQAELQGTAKQLIRLRVTEPPIKVSLAGVGVGRYERALGIEDLPVPGDMELQLNRLVSPRTLELQLDRKARRVVPAAIEVEGAPGPTALWDGTVRLRPARVSVAGPAAAIAALDTVHLQPVSLGGRRDTLTVAAEPLGLPDWCVMEPERVEVWIPLEPAITRRFTVDLEPHDPGAAETASPDRVTAIVTASRRLMGEAFSDVRATWRSPAHLSAGESRRVAVRPGRALADGIQVRFEPESVTVHRAR